MSNKQCPAAFEIRTVDPAGTCQSSYFKDFFSRNQ
jgi:hypothetical protein